MSELDRHKEDQKVSFLRQMESLRPDLFYPEAWTDDQRKAASTSVAPERVKTNMFASIPMNCKGSKCVFHSTCPLLAQNIAPVGKPCPIEMSFVQEFFSDYVQELGVDTTRMVEVSMIRDLVDQEIQHLRAIKVLADEHFIQDNIVGVDGEGRPIVRKELHQAVEFESKIFRNKDKLRSQLLATREAKAKVGQANLDTAQAVANLLEQVNELDRQRQELLARKLGRDQFYDAYIEAHEVVEELPSPEDE